MKKSLKYIFWTIFAFVIAILLLPFIFKQELIDGITNAINDQINAEIEFEDASISFLKSFPHVNINIEKLRVKNNREFEGTTLFEVDEIDLSTDLMSVFKRSEGLKILDIELTSPILNLKVNKDGYGNWDILKNKETDDDGEIYGNIEHYSLSNGTINYYSQENMLALNMEGIQHSGKGDFRDIVFDLVTRTEIEKLNLVYDNIPYLINSVVKGDMNILVDLEKDKYSFKDNLIYINDLALSFLGDMTIKESEYVFDIKYNAPNNKVSSLFSLIPNAYNQGYDKVKSEGHATLTGLIKGRYNSEQGIYPEFKNVAQVNNGVIKYEGFKYPIEDINLDLIINAREGNWNDLNLNFSKLNFSIDKEQIIASLKANNVFGNPEYDGFINGKLNLNTLSKAFPLPQYEDLKGIIKADIRLKTNQKSIEDKNYASMIFDGIIEIDQFGFIYEDDYPISLQKSLISANPEVLNVSYQDLYVSKSHFNGEIKMKDPLKLLSNNGGTVNMDNTIASDGLDLTELQAISTAFGNKVSVQDSINSSPLNSTTNFNTTFKVNFSKATYEDYNLTGIYANGYYSNDTLKLSESQVNINGNNIKARAELTNLLPYINENKQLSGNLFVESPSIDFTTLSSNQSKTTKKDSVIIIPKNINLDIYPEIKSLTYGAYNFKNFDAKLNISNGVASIIDGQARIFEGIIKMEGSYDSSAEGMPVFNFKYNLSELAISKMFEVSKSFRALAPIAKYVDGIFNSTLILSGPMTKEMLPDLYKINASGLFETVKGKIAGFEPLEKLANTLGLDELKNWDIKDSKNWFDIKEGTVYLKETDYNFSDMEFKVAGKHSLDQNIEYLIKAKIPREKLRKAQIVKQLDMGYDFFLAEAKKRGIKIDQGDFLFLDIYITENLKNPKFKIIPVGAGGQSLKEQIEGELKSEVDKLKEEAKSKVDQKKQEVQDSLSKVVETKKDEIITKVDKEVDKQVEKVKDIVKDKVKAQADSILKNEVADTIRTKIADELKDVIGKNSQSEIDSIKAKLKDWNPFKKKKGK